MLDHLIEFTPDVDDDSAGFVAFEKTAPPDLVDAQVKTADWLQSLGAAGDEVSDELEAQAALLSDQVRGFLGRVRAG